MQVELRNTYNLLGSSLLLAHNRVGVNRSDGRQEEEEGAEAQEGQGTSHAMWSQNETWSSSAWGAGAQEGHDEEKNNDVQGWTDQEAIEAANALYHPEEDPESWAQDREADDWDEEEWVEDKEDWPDTDRSV